jgi:thiol-disulfide isomerase/thioredoxin
MTAVKMAIGVLAGLLVASAGSAAEGWQTDWEKAKASATKDGKDILLDFTGSDWCGWCIKLDKEVFSQEAFKTYAAAHLVLMEADFPRKKEQGAETKEQNRTLQGQFGVSGFPTIFLTDAQGRPFARTGYREGGAEAYATHLKELIQVRVKRDEVLAQAKGAQGLERAKLLAAALDPLPVNFLVFYADLTQELQDLDKENQTGFKAKFTEIELAGLEGQVQSLSRAGRTAEALAKVDTFITANNATGELQQKALLAKLGAYPPGNLENVAAADALMDQIIAVDAATETATYCQDIKKNIVQIRAQLTAKQAAKPAATPAP